MTVRSLCFVSLFPSNSSPEGTSWDEYADFVKSTASCLQSDFDVKRFALRLSFKKFVSGGGGGVVFLFVYNRGADCCAP